MRRDLVRNRVPTAPGGGTVAFVDPVGHRYLDDPVAREEGGTPAIVESIRAGLVVTLKQAGPSVVEYFDVGVGRPAAAGPPPQPFRAGMDEVCATVADYLIDAVDLIATGGHRLLGDYHFDPHTGLWRHRHAAQTPLRLADLHYTADGTLVGPARQPSAGEDVLGGYLHQSADVISRRPDAIDDGPTGLPAEFEALRWFHLPPACLTHPDRATIG